MNKCSVCGAASGSMECYRTKQPVCQACCLKCENRGNVFEIDKGTSISFGRRCLYKFPKAKIYPALPSSVANVRHLYEKMNIPRLAEVYGDLEKKYEDCTNTEHRAELRTNLAAVQEKLREAGYFG